MQLFQVHNAGADTASDLSLARARKLSLRDAIPFGSRSYTVAPGASATVERYDDLELSTVVTGMGMVEVAGRIADIDEGEAVLFGSGETHVVHNRSTTEPLVVSSIFWMPWASVVGSHPPVVSAAS